MAIDEFEMSAEAKQAIADAGYGIYGGMDALIKTWNAWYEASDDFYTDHYYARNNDGESIKKPRPRYTLHPAKRVCREYASLMLTEDTKVSVEGKEANAWLQAYLAENNFWPNGQNLVERAFSVGTGSWVLDFDIKDADEDSRIRMQRYDARGFKPLSYDAEGITECAVATRMSCKGKQVERLTLYVIEGGTYHVKTMLFSKGERLTPEDYGYMSDFDTRSARKPFGVVRPAIENTAADLCPYGMSIFADALSAIKAVDLAFDSLFQEVDLTAVKVFMDEELIDVRSQDGKLVPLSRTDQQVFRAVDGANASKKIDVFSPDIRTAQLKDALDIALAELGEICGFGQNYFTLDKAGGLKTATEVVAENGALMRNVRKHENILRGAVQDVVSALLENARIHCGAQIEESFGAVSVEFDDSVITDTQTAKAQMLAEIAAGVVPKWMYLKEYMGMSEEEAKAALPQEPALELGF